MNANNLSKQKKNTSKANAKFKENLKEQREFFGIPTKIDLFKTAALISLNILIKNLPQQHSEEAVKQFIRTDKIARKILNYSNSEMDDQDLSDIVIACHNLKSEQIPIIDANFNPDDLLNQIDQISDIDKNKKFNLQSFLNNDLINTLSLYFLLEYIITMTRDLFQKTNHPPKYRTKYIQRLLRNVYNIIKEELKTAGKTIATEFKKILAALKQIDNLLVAITILTATYFINRANLQKRSRQSLNEISKDKVCADFFEPNDIAITPKPFVVSFDCPIDNDDDLIPHTPIEEKLKNISCEISQNEEIINDASVKEDLATFAIIKNNKRDIFEPKITIDSFVDTQTLLGSVGGAQVFSPIAGYVDNLSTNQIVIRDIDITSEDYLTKQIELLNEKYMRLNDIKSFIKAYYVDTLYPIMLKTSTIDTSTFDIIIGVKAEFKGIQIKYKIIDKIYDKKIKKITNKNNVEKHAKNETLNKIKEDVEKTNTNFFNNIKLLGTKAINISKKTKVFIGEYDLSEYYNNLYATLKDIKKPNKIEIEFKSQISKYVAARKLKTTNHKKQTIEEGNFIENYFNILWKDYFEIPNDVEIIQKNIEKISLFTTYSIVKYEDKDARFYSINEEQTCKPEIEDEYLSPKTKYSYGDIQYWIKYCAGATLASVINPVTGWSTGWIVGPPIQFPVIYIPLKPITTSYGFIVFGISVCGIFIFPWTLFVNYTTGYTTPFGDPTAAIKREIQALKKEISTQSANFKKDIIKGMLNEIKKEIDLVKDKIISTKTAIVKNKNERPIKPQLISLEQSNSFKEKLDIETTNIETSISYTKQIESWLKQKLSLNEFLLTLKKDQWILTKKYDILNKAYKSGKSTKGANKKIEDAEKALNKQLDNLSGLVDKANKLLAALPIAISPDSANFGFTLKNPKPIINIADDLDDNVNITILDKIIKPFKLKNEDLLSAKYNAKISSSVINFKKYKQALVIAMPIIIEKDPFPKYELLSPINLAWNKFLIKDFTTTGAKTYGFPGFPPY